MKKNKSLELKPSQLGDYFRIKHGFAFKGEFFTDSGKYILLTPGNFQPEGGLKLKGDKEKYYSAEFPPEFLLKSGDLLLAMTDLIQNAPILGSPALITETNRYLHNQRLGKIIDLDTSKLDKNFLYHLMNFSEVREQIKGSATGSTVRHTAPDRIYKVRVRIPPIATQRRIADILSAYDDLIENNARRIRILEQMAQAIYQEWFGKMDKESLPEGWEEKTLGDIAQDIRRNVHPNDIDPETPYFGLEHLPRKSIALSEWGKAGDVQSTKLAFKKGEILFGKIRPYFHKVGVAPLDGVASSDTIIIAPKSPEYFGHVLSYVFSEDFVNHATRTSQGTKMPRANWGVLVKYPILIPPKPILEQFNQTINDFVGLIQNLLFRNRNLRQTRDLLLPRLVSGEIAV